MLREYQVSRSTYINDFEVKFILFLRKFTCQQANETLHHLMTDCEATNMLQRDIMKNLIPLPDMTWSVKDINTFIQHPTIHLLMTYDTQYNAREIEFIEHNCSSEASSS